MVPTWMCRSYRVLASPLGRCSSKPSCAFAAPSVINLEAVRTHWIGLSYCLSTLLVVLLAGTLQLPAQISTQTNYNPNGYDAVSILNAIEHPHSDLVVVIGHRGAHALINGEFPTIPENSLQSVRDAASAGWEAIEIDVKNTSDGIPILTHDYTWGRETCGIWADGGGPSIRFNPFVAPGNSGNDAHDPQVSTISLARTKYWSSDTTTLRDSITLQQATLQGCSGAFSGLGGEYPPTLTDVLSEMTRDKIGMVLTLDIKDAATAKASWDILKSYADYKGRLIRSP